MTTITPWHYSSVGFTSVGDGIQSSGEWNTNSGSCAAIIENALSNGAGVVLRKGTYVLDRFVNVVGEGKQIVLSAGAEVRNATTGAVGCFRFNSPRQVLTFAGGKIVANTWVDSQKLVHVPSGADYFSLNDFYADVTTTGGNTSTPMEACVIENVIDPTVNGYVLHPNIGVRGMTLTRTSGGIISRVRIRTNTSTFAVSQRSCYEGIRGLGCRDLVLTDIQLLALGTLTTSEMNEGIIFQGDPNITTVEGERSGLKMQDVSIVSCASPKGLSLWGLIGFKLNGIRLENFMGAVAAAGEAALFITSKDGTSTAGDSTENKICTGMITDITFEACAVSAGNAAYIQDAKKIDLLGGHIHIPTNSPTNMILVNSVRAREINIDRIRFDGDQVNAKFGVAFEGQTPAANIRSVYIGGHCHASGILYGVCPGREPAVGYTSKSAYDDGTWFPVINLSGGASAIQPITDNTGVTIDPDFRTTIPAITTASGTASGSASYAIAVLSEKVNRLNNGLGYFQTDLVDNGGGAAADGTIGAISDQATFAAAVKELSTKINEIIALPQSAAGKIKMWKTIVNGPGTAGAVALLTDSSGGAASATGTIPVVTTYGAGGDGANAIATLALVVNTMLSYITFSQNASNMASKGL